MNSGATIDIDALLDARPLHARQMVVAAALLLMFFFNNFCLQVLSLTAPPMALDWQVSAQALAAPMAMGWFGGAVGALAGGIIGDRIGRRWTVVATTLMAALGTLATAFAHGPGQLLLLRAVVGLGLGGSFPVGLALLTECLPPKRRGPAVSAAMLCGPLGIIGCAMISTVLISAYGWPALFLAGGGALLLAGAILALVLVESPGYLARLPDRRAELSHVMLHLGVPLDPAAPIAVPSGPARVSPAEVLSPALRGATIRTWLSFFVVFLVVSSLLSWLPTILAGAGYSVAVGGAALTAWSGGGIVGTVATGWCIGRWGAGRSAQALAVGAAFALGLLVLTPLGPGTALMALLVPMAIAGFTLSGVMTALYGFATGLYPAGIRASGVGMADMIGRATSVLASFGAVFALDAMGMRGFFTAMSALALLPLVLLAMRRPAQIAPAAKPA